MCLFQCDLEPCRSMGDVNVLAHVIGAERGRLWTDALLNNCAHSNAAYEWCVKRNYGARFPHTLPRFHPSFEDVIRFKPDTVTSLQWKQTYSHIVWDSPIKVSVCISETTQDTSCLSQWTWHHSRYNAKTLFMRSSLQSESNVMHIHEMLPAVMNLAPSRLLVVACNMKHSVPDPSLVQFKSSKLFADVLMSSQVLPSKTWRESVIQSWPIGMMMLRCCERLSHQNCEFSTVISTINTCGTIAAAVGFQLFSSRHAFVRLARLPTTEILTTLSMYCNCEISTVSWTVINGDLSIVTMKTSLRSFLPMCISSVPSLW